MKSRKPKSKKALIIVAAVLGALVIVTAVAFAVLGIRTAKTQDDYSSVFSNPKYATPVAVEGVSVITQEVSCGYAVIEMFSTWSGHDVTEESLYAEYGKVVTSTAGAFCDEMNKWFPEYTTAVHKYLTNTELLDLVYDNLAAGVPVPVEWAALYGDVWTLHYSLITGMDIPNDRITVANPYGYVEELTVDEFLARTIFRAYENMPLFLRFAFAFGVFEKNTVFTVR